MEILKLQQHIEKFQKNFQSITYMEITPFHPAAQDLKVHIR